MTMFNNKEYANLLNETLFIYVIDSAYLYRQVLTLFLSLSSLTYLMCCVILSFLPLRDLIFIDVNFFYRC